MHVVADLSSPTTHLLRTPVSPSTFRASNTLRRLGSDPGHHFFGYYNKTPWDSSGRLLLANRVPMMNADITPAMLAEVGYFELDNKECFVPCDHTRAWNWQMGCQLQWLGGDAHRGMIYNVRTADSNAIYPHLGAMIHDIDTGKRRKLPLPVYVVAPNGQFALCVDYRRLAVSHPTIGYCNDRPASVLEGAPAGDGIHYLDTGTGEAHLVLSYRALREFHSVPSMDKALHWVSHIEISPSSSRVVLLHRWTERVEDETCFLHRLITMNPDGTGLRLLEDSDHPLPQLRGHFDPSSVGTFDYEKSEHQISHPLWRDDASIIVWSPHAGRINYHLYRDDDSQDVSVIGAGVLRENGHMSFSPVNSRWLLSDTYPDSGTHERVLFIFDTENGLRHDIGSFYADPTLSKENRCDLHPRWNRNGTQVCIDSVHAGERQMYVIDVSEITTPEGHTSPPSGA